MPTTPTTPTHLRAGIALLAAAAAAWALPTLAATAITTPTTKLPAGSTVTLIGDRAEATFSLPQAATQHRTGERSAARLEDGHHTVVAFIAPSQDDIPTAAQRLARASSQGGQTLTLTGSTGTSPQGWAQLGCRMVSEADDTAGPCTILGTPHALLIIGALSPTATTSTDTAASDTLVNDIARSVQMKDTGASAGSTTTQEARR